jgi:hypothetical protein
VIEGVQKGIGRSCGDIVQQARGSVYTRLSWVSDCECEVYSSGKSGEFEM